MTALSDAVTRLVVVQRLYDDTKAAGNTLLERTPAFDANAFTTLADWLRTLSPSTPVRLTLGQFGTLYRAALSSAIGNLGRARAFLALPIPKIPMANKLSTAAKNTLTALSNLVDAITRSQSLVSRATGLGEPIEIGVGAIVLSTIAIVVGAAFVYAIYSSIHAGQVASAEADAACSREAAAGRPCTGADYARYHDAAMAAQRDMGLVPDFRPLSSAIGWGLGLGILGLFAYGAWVAAPAASITRERLRARASR